MDRHASRALMRRLNRDAAVIAARFGLRYRSIEAEAARLYSDLAVRMRGGWTREPVYGH